MLKVRPKHDTAILAPPCLSLGWARALIIAHVLVPQLLNCFGKLPLSPRSCTVMTFFFFQLLTLTLLKMNEYGYYNGVIRVTATYGKYKYTT